MIRNIKFQIVPSDEDLDDNKIIYELKNLRKVSMKACNIASSLQFLDMMNKKQKINTDYGKKLDYYIEDKMKEIMNGYGTANIAQTRAFVLSKSNFNKEEISSGERSVSSYKLTNPIILHNKSYNIYTDNDKNWYIDISLFNREKQKELGVKRITFKIMNLYDSAIPIIQRIINGEYKQGAGQITYNDRKEKWMFGLAYSFESKSNDNLDPNRIFGVDLGIVNTATYSIYDMTNGTYDYIDYSYSIISGDELRKYRDTIYRKRVAMSRATKWSSENKIGHSHR
jgi:transposase